MKRENVFVVTTIALGFVAFWHALVTWPLSATVVFFHVAIGMAFIGEAVVISRGWLHHHLGLQIFGVPIYVLFGWAGTIYVAFRVSLVVTDGFLAVGLAALIATAYDVIVDPRGVADGYWTYSEESPGPRFRGIPIWNFIGWFILTAVTAAATLPFR